MGQAPSLTLPRTMPELPEVETTARLIRPKLVGRSIERARVHWARSVGGRKAAFERALPGARVAAVWRRAKFIVIDLEREGETDSWLVGHLRMSGRMHVEKPGWDAGPHARVEFELDNGRSFHFIDVRKFGRLLHVTDLAAVLGKLGPEPLDEEFDADAMHRGLRARKRMLKPLLLDQAFIAGLGNIYVDESLHLCGLHPLTRSDRVGPLAARRLLDAVRWTLRAAIEREGSSFDPFYRTPEGQPGSYQHQFLAYGRTGRPCRFCDGVIERIVVGQRGTHLCRACQPRRGSGREIEDLVEVG